jgi:enterochelin esterase-like enzyme
MKDQMRVLWQPVVPVFIQDYLVCGPFAEPAPHSAPATRPGRPEIIRPTAYIDYLSAAGGEPNVRPQKGQVLTTGDGARFTWEAYSSKANLINLAEAIPAAKDKSCVAYAYASVHRDSPGQAAIAIWGRAFLTVYLNGRRIMDPNDRDALLDGAYLPIRLEEGDNALLIRVAGVTDQWPFSLRVVNETDLPVDDPALLRATIVSDDPSALAVKVGNDNRLAPDVVAVSVLGPAGKLVAQQDVPLGRTHRFDTAAWDDGPYEVRAMVRSPTDKLLTRDLLWYKGDWRQEVAGVMAEVETLPSDSDDPIVLKQQLARDILLARLCGDIRKGTAATQPAEQADMNNVITALLEYREAVMQRQAPTITAGFYRLAWRDEVDGSPQFARAYLPMNYDPAKKYPLVIYLHGHNARNPTYASDDPGVRHRLVAEQYDIIRMEPHGRGNTGFQGIGEADVMRAVAEAQKTFNVNDERIYLTGGSMGGGGAWYVGTRHTDVFAALGPIYGGWDYHIWTSQEELATWPPQQVSLEEADSSFAQAENLLHTPVFVNHGDSDKSVNVENSRYAVRMLQRWGYDVRYWEHPGKGHASGLGVGNDVVEWFLRYRLCRAPRHVLLRAPELSGANAHWVHAEQQEDPFAFMLVDAVVSPGNVLTITSQNVLQLRLNPPKELVDVSKPIQVIWNGQAVKDFQVTPDGQIILRAKGYAPGELVKKGTLPTPFAIVVGTTSKDERMNRFCQLLAERARDDWNNWQHVSPRYFKDTEITDEQVRKYSLILYGGPEDNAVTARLIKDIPLTIESGRITLDDRAFDAPDAAVRILYPHPLNDERHVAIIAANSAEAMFWADRMPDNVDFVIDDGRVGSENDYLRRLVAWGRFDCNWRLNEKYLIAGDPGLRAKAGRFCAPSQLTLVTPQRRLYLGDVLETKAFGSFVRMMRNLNWQGRPMKLAGKTYAKGIAVECWREACKANYDLTDGNWKRLRATIGIEIDTKLADIKPEHREGTRVVFVVRGDGKELYKSPVFRIDSKPVNLDVDITGVKMLELEVLAGSRRDNIASSVDWADVRLEK